MARLIELLNAFGFGGDSVRHAAAKALGAIRDPRGLKPVIGGIARGKDAMGANWAELKDAIAAFGPMAEPELWTYLSGDKLLGLGPKHACELLGLVGTAREPAAPGAGPG